MERVTRAATGATHLQLQAIPTQEAETRAQ